MYPGAICRATVSVYAYDNKGRGYALGLSNLQKLKDGPRLDNKKSAAEELGNVEIDEAYLDQIDNADQFEGLEA